MLWSRGRDLTEVINKEEREKKLPKNEKNGQKGEKKLKKLNFLGEPDPVFEPREYLSDLLQSSPF